MCIKGIILQKDKKYAVCHIEELSEELKDLIRKNLTIICHGSCAEDYKDDVLFSYQSTLSDFLERYNKKTEDTKKGMVGEFLAHILLPIIFEDYEIASAFFNLEEKSIKKGFDMVMYKVKDSSTWITEVKSGNLHKNQDHDGTISDLLDTARSDLSTRLSAGEKTYWYNAIHHVRSYLNDEKDYKKALMRVLVDKGNAAAINESESKKHSVILVSNLFEPLGTKISSTPAEKFLKKIEGKYFLDVLVFCVQKETYSRIMDFFELEAAKAIK
jgi:hypothetical protein